MKIKQDYKGHSITYLCGCYWACCMPFKTIKAAKKHIDEFEN